MNGEVLIAKNLSKVVECHMTVTKCELTKAIYKILKSLQLS